MAEEWLKAASRPLRPARVDASVPSMARVWDYMVGGRDNFEADRRAVRRMLAVAPVLSQMGHAGRAFYRRAVAYLAAEAGMRQFIDVSLGMPTSSITHEVAHAVAPDCRVVYIASDPVALSHARALLSSPAEGITSYADADPHCVEAILAGARGRLDLAAPVAFVMIDVLNFVEDASAFLSQLMAGVPSGSYAAVMQVVPDKRLDSAAQWWNRIMPSRVFIRGHAEVSRWLDGLEAVDPGVVEVHRWRPEPGDRDFPGGMPLLGVVARKP